jgi:hypothetical protein
MMLNIPNDVAQTLEALASRQDSTVGDLLRNLLNRYAPDSSIGSLAEMAQNAEQAGLGSAEQVDTAANSRAILSTEYGDYLKRRMGADSDDDHRG